MFSSSKNSVSCRQLLSWAEMAPVAGGVMVPEVPFVHAVPFSSTVRVLLSKKKMAEKAKDMRVCQEVVAGPRNREVLTCLNSVVYRKVGTIGTERQEGQVMRAKSRLLLPPVRGTAMRFSVMLKAGV